MNPVVRALVVGGKVAQGVDVRDIACDLGVSITVVRRALRDYREAVDWLETSTPRGAGVEAVFRRAFKPEGIHDGKEG